MKISKDVLDERSELTQANRRSTPAGAKVNGSQKPKRDFSLRVEMTNTAKMSSRQSGATRDLKKEEQTSKYHDYETIYKTDNRIY